MATATDTIIATGETTSALMNCSDDNGGKHERDDVYEKTAMIVGRMAAAMFDV